MAKRSAPAAAPAAPAASLAVSIASRAISDKAVDLGKQQPDVIEWDGGNGQSTFQQGTLPADPAPTGIDVAADGAPADGAADPSKNDGQQPASTEQNQQDGGNEGGTVSPPAAAAPPPKPKGADARRGALQALDAERQRVTLEQQARANADRATAAEHELQRVRSLPLREQLKWINANKEDLAEAVLVGGDDVADLPDKPAAPKTDPQVAELLAKVAALEARDQAAQRQSAQQVIAGAHQLVADTLKEVATVPMVKGVRDIVIDGQAIHSGIDLTLRVANQAWLQAGRAGHPRDYVPGAAETVEEYLRGKRPDLAAVFVQGATPPRAVNDPPPASNGSTSIGKRTGARPDAQPKELPSDRHQRDMQIKREMGWT